MWFVFEKNWTMWCSLGLTGGWKTEKDSHSCLELDTQDTQDTKVWFSDKIGYGSIKFCNSNKMMMEKLNSLGPDLLSNTSYTYEDFEKVIKKNGIVV